MRKISKSNKMDNICYEIRGPLLKEAKRLEDEGYTIIKLNSGNPPAFGLNAPDEIIRDVVLNIRAAQAYGDSKGLFPARKAIMQQCQLNGIEGVEIEDVYVGNGVSEMIMMAMQGLLNNGDEMLVPSPDYPLWTAAVALSGGTPVHYMCDEASDWNPDLKDLESKITSRTKGIVLINPNNPTGAVYPKEVLVKTVEMAEKHELILFSDEIYDQILYDGVEHVPLASLSKNIFCVTFNGLSKSHRIPGMRAGWMVVSGKKALARDYITEGLDILSNMRMCGNMAGQLAIQTALGGYQTLKQMISPGGRLYEQRRAAYECFNTIPGISCVKPKGALYLFPRIDVKRYNIHDDQKFLLDFLTEKKVLLVQGTGFNWPAADHFRVVFLPPVEEIRSVAERMADFLKKYHQ
ncbi:pyridoxal phosphate-dependent aminotransferase [Syntrophorhabdus aromaticivorans]|uniref:alanine transaminase n=1 Tax=Syntrophorhabdus aromaticivorans TaxID=328301 RepID=A0A351U851_9BACT|nr:pyridoxal phosphate-dependent aminotransferase [Syntrophorhabdus aromaticivorans]NLW36752.1 pyridoxal phosphate-dependent aminotransferase [Syntrophorhabdus aromaticivorans]HBA56132.1 pyridoxal phosphate-dependent aminotransferase [Syntrophorhabdus aromaticivorans]